MPNFPVELAGDGPCAGVYVFERGSVARIETLSRSEARDYYDRRVAGIALDPLLARAATACVDPRRAAARVRHLLREAGLSHVAVRVEGQGGCLAPGGYVMEDDEVVLSRTTQP
jgi:hypothetical protein